MERMDELLRGLLINSRAQGQGSNNNNNNNDGVSVPLIARLLERVQLWRKQPYQLMGANNALEKSVMASEAARRVTFEHWPHMHYRWLFIQCYVINVM